MQSHVHGIEARPAGRQGPGDQLVMGVGDERRGLCVAAVACDLEQARSLCAFNLRVWQVGREERSGDRGDYKNCDQNCSDSAMAPCKCDLIVQPKEAVRGL